MQIEPYRVIKYIYIENEFSIVFMGFYLEQVNNPIINLNFTTNMYMPMEMEFNEENKYIISI